MTGRTGDFARWCDDLAPRMAGELARLAHDVPRLQRAGSGEAAPVARSWASVGLTILRAVRSNEQCYGEVSDLLVARNARGHGIGGALLG